jgi:hypothetical protein
MNDKNSLQKKKKMRSEVPETGWLGGIMGERQKFTHGGRKFTHVGRKSTHVEEKSTHVDFQSFHKKATSTLVIIN